MFYTAGNYDAFVHARKPKGADKKSAYIVGSGLAGLSSAFYLVRDGHVKGDRIHILEKLPISGGSCDGRNQIDKGFYMRGGREMDNHFEVMWDMYKDIPSYEDPSMSVLDYYYYLNLEDPNYSLCRATINRGEDAHTDKLNGLSDKAQEELLKFYMTPEKDLEDKKISDVLDEEFFKSNFWLYWQTMFAFQRWSSALEMKRYLHRFIHHIDGLPDFTALRFTKYNQYESMILPLQNWLIEKGVHFDFDCDVKNVIFEIDGGKKIAKTIEIVNSNGENKNIDLTEDDLVFITNGCCTDSTCYGDQNTAPDLSKLKEGKGESWDLWKNMAKQVKDGSFGNPDVFCGNINETNWMSATIQTHDEEIISLIKNICKRDPRLGKVTTGGIVTVKDSMDNWYCSWTINRQPQFKSQDSNDVLVWFYALTTNKEGNYVKKPMRECKGYEVAMEWLYHIGCPTDKIEEFAKNRCNTTTSYMPYIDAFFQPRKNEDRPKVVVSGAVNFAFVGQFAETPRDCIFTTEYSIRTGMEAVYTLMNVERGVPEVWGSEYDLRALLNATYYIRDKKPVTDMSLPLLVKLAMKIGLKKIKDTDIELLLKEEKVIK